MNRLPEGSTVHTGGHSLIKAYICQILILGSTIIFILRQDSLKELNPGIILQNLVIIQKTA